MLDLQEPYSKCIAILSQAQLDGITDPAFVSLLGGLLFMDHKGGDAQRIFNESTRQGFTFEEKTGIQFRPLTPSSKDPLQLTGRVISVRPGFLFVENEGYPRFFTTI